MSILFKSRTGHEIMLRPVGLSPEALAREDFGLAPDVLAKAARGDDAERGKRARKVRKALWHASVPSGLRGRIYELAQRQQSLAANDGPQAPGARGGSALAKERDALVGDIMGRGDIPQKVQTRLVELVHDSAPITLISPRTAHEGAAPYPAFETYPGK